MSCGIPERFTVKTIRFGMRFAMKNTAWILSAMNLRNLTIQIVRLSQLSVRALRSQCVANWIDGNGHAYSLSPTQT